MLESQIKSIADTGVTVIVTGAKFGDMALHYLNKFGIMGVKLPSKWDVRRLCKTVGATPLPRLVRTRKRTIRWPAACVAEFRYLAKFNRGQLAGCLATLESLETKQKPGMRIALEKALNLLIHLSKNRPFFSNNNNKITTTKKPCSENLFKSWLKLLLRKRSRKHPQKRGKLPLQTFERALYSVFAWSPPLSPPNSVF